MIRINSGHSEKLNLMGRVQTGTCGRIQIDPGKFQTDLNQKTVRICDTI
jgi:hypothetical protein